MAHKTFEANKDGKVAIYPSLYEAKDRGIRKFFKDLLKRLFPSRKR